MKEWYNITVVLLEVNNELLEVLKNAESLVISVTDPAENLQVFLSAAQMRSEVVSDLPPMADPSEVAGLALHPGEGREV